MKRWMTTAAAALTLALGAPAAAQEPSREAQAADIAAQLVDKLRVLSDALGIDAPLLPSESLAAALAGAIPVLPEGDGRDWSSSFGFDFETERATAGGLEADAEGRRVFTDARSCVADGEIAEVVHFERFARGDIRGHRCVLSQGGDSDADDAWILVSRTFAEGPGGRLDADYAIAVVVTDDPGASRRMLEARLEQNVAVAGLLADYALELFVLNQTPSDPLTIDNFAERYARLQARMAEAAESFDAPAHAAGATPVP